jgi:SNF2 family DNA or RNA helicase
MITAAPIIGVTLSKSRQKLVLRGPKNDAASVFYQTLPASRWDDTFMAWTVEATPSAAWRLLNECPVAVEADDAVLKLATVFAESLDVIHEGQQPPVRKTDGWRHQVAAYHFADAKAGTMLAMGMGVGKSKVTVDLIVNRGAMRSIILCPASVLPVWRREFEKHAGKPVAVLVLAKGTVADKTRQADAFLKQSAARNAPAVVVINYESAWRSDFATWSLKQQWDVAVCDESHRIKTHDSKQSKYAAQLGKAAAFRLCLTGTPMPHSPLDLFGQFRFLDRGVFGTWFHHFRNRYAKLNPIFPSKVDAWLNQDELKQRFSLLAYRVTADEVLDLPPVMHEERRVTLCPKAKKIYESLEDDLIADVGSGVVTATNALTRLIRLQQLTSGYVIEDETKRETEVDDAKKLALFELLDDIGPEPVVVFCRFRHDLVAVADCAEKLGREYGELSGRFKHGLDDRGCMVEGVQVMGVQIQSGGVGVDLTRARYCVFFSQCWSLGDFDQALARVHRPGQTRPVSYYHLVAGGTIDDIMRKALEAKRDVVEMILEALRR